MQVQVDYFYLIYRLYLTLTLVSHFKCYHICLQLLLFKNFHVLISIRWSLIGPFSNPVANRQTK